MSQPGNVICVAASKGGTGKSSLSTGLAYLCSLRGYRTLFIDMDPSAGAAFDLGIRGTDAYDDGASLFDSLAHLRPLQPVKDVRDSLDVVVGGTMTSGVSGLEAVWESRLDSKYLALSACLEPIRANYDMVIIDTAPGEQSVNQLNSLAAAKYVVIPTRSDAASLDGIGGVGTAFRQLRGIASPQLLAVVMFGVNPSARRVSEETRASLVDSLPAGTLVCTTPVRYAEKAASAARRMGMTVVEYARDVADTAPRYWEAGGKDVNVAKSAGKVAGDYIAVTAEILAAWQEAEFERKSSTAPRVAEGGRA